MNLFDRYLGKAVIVGTALALLLLVSLNVLIDFVNEVDEVGKRGYTLLQASLYTFYTIPRRIYEFFPTSVLLGSLLSLGNLAAHNELVVMRAAGVSVYQIIASVMKVGMMLILAAFLLGEFVMPESEQQAQSVRNVLYAKRVRLGTRDGLWAKDGDRFLNVRDLYPGRRLAEIWVYELDDALKLRKATFAKSAVYKDDHWLLTDVVHSVVGLKGVSTERHAQERWQRLLSPELFDVVVVAPKKMSARKLTRYIRYLKANNLDARRYELAFWTRFTVPLSGALMMLLTVPFVFGPLRHSGAGQRLFIGMLIGVSFHLVNQAVANLGLVYKLPPLIGAVLPLVILLGVGLVAIRRVN